MRKKENIEKKPFDGDRHEGEHRGGYGVEGHEVSHFTKN